MKEDVEGRKKDGQRSRDGENRVLSSLPLQLLRGGENIVRICPHAQKEDEKFVHIFKPQS